MLVPFLMLLACLKTVSLSLNVSKVTKTGLTPLTSGPDQTIDDRNFGLNNLCGPYSLWQLEFLF